MIRRRVGAAIGLIAAVGGCATKGQVDRLTADLTQLRIEGARRDSARAAALAQIIALQQRLVDSLAAGRQALRLVENRLSADLTEVQRQLLQVQQLTGQSQSRLSELKAQLDARAEQAEAAGLGRPATPDTGRAAAPAPTATADQMYQSARQLQLRGSLITARRGFHEFVRTYPEHQLVPNALVYIGDTFAGELPDSAVHYYGQVVTRSPRSGQAPTALYKLGRLEETRRNAAAARRHYERILREYPRADEADLARDRLSNLRP
ncbi:MAG: tetratricopeptide repeat protein [Gemmatimonadales bacterium]